MILTSCKKAIIYADKGENPLCEVVVSAIKDDSVLLLFDDVFMEHLESEMHVTFFDSALGLVTYVCSLSNPKKFLSDDHIWLQELTCVLNREVEVLQRRSDYKIKVDIAAEVLVPAGVEDVDKHPNVIRHGGDFYFKANVQNLSAGGIYFECPFSFPTTTVLNMRLPLGSPVPLLISTKVLRVLTPEERAINNPHISEVDGVYGYGCSFFKLSASAESAIRGYVFKQQIRVRGGSRK